MQIMNLGKILKDVLWNLTAFKTLDALPDSVILVNNDGEINRFNKKAQQVLGLNYDESIIKFNEIIKDGMNILRNSADSAKPALACVSKSGAEFYVEINAVNKLGGYLVTLRDITKLTREIDNDDKTRRFNNEKNAMLALLEDDIKAPISSINGFSKGLLDGLGGELTEKQAKYVQIISNNSHDLYVFMSKFLQFSKAESSIYQSDYHNCDITETLKNVASEYEEIIKSKNLEFDIDGNLLEKRNANIDLPSVKEAFKNILEVVIQMTESGYISVRLAHPDEDKCIKYNISPENSQSYVEITITNTATIPEEEKRYLCEPYAQLEKGKKNLLRAFALGSASIMTKRANGLFDVYSDSNGTRFTMILPVEKR